jgi:hypothetical protein
VWNRHVAGDAPSTWSSDTTNWAPRRRLDDYGRRLY